jgi:membrane protease YdiL (CAAX protease family)
VTTQLPPDLWRRPNWSVQPKNPPQRRPLYEFVVIGLLVAWNLIANAAIPRGAAIVLGIAGVIVLLVVARRGGTSWDYLGLNRQSLSQGIRVGMVGVGVVALGVVAATSLPLSREVFADERFVGVGTGEMLYETLVRIPFSTALAEEVAFRSALLGMLLLWFSPLKATITSSALFGLWHILPGLTALDTNPAGDVGGGFFGAAAGVAVQVVLTGLVGAVLAWTRFRGDNLVASVLIHWGINGAAYAAGWLVVRNAWA